MSNVGWMVFVVGYAIVMVVLVWSDAGGMLARWQRARREKKES